MMKTLLKQLWTLFSIIILWWLLNSSVLAYIQPSDSRALTFNSGKITLYMGQNGSQFFLDAVYPTQKPISCEIKAWVILYPRNNCDDIAFSYNGSSRDITIYVQYDNDQGTFVYNTSSQRFTSAILGLQDTIVPGDEPPYSHQGYISLSSNTSSVQINDYINLTLEMYDRYGSRDRSNRDSVRISILRQSGGAYYTAASSDYYLRSATYTFTSSDAGYVNLMNYVRFSTSGTYKIRVENTSIYRTAEIIISVGNWGWSTQTDARSFEVDAYPTDPSLYQTITTTLTARDNSGNRAYNYRGSAKLMVEKRDNGSSFWYSAPTSEYTLSSSNVYLGSSQQGSITLSNHLRFSSQGNYRLRVYDVNNSSINGYKVFSVWNTTSNVSRLELTTNRNQLAPNQYANLTLRAKDSNENTVTSYTNTVRFEVYRRANTSQAWSNITSSTNNNSNYTLTNQNYVFTPNNNGVVTLYNFISFSSNTYDYMVKAIDQSNSSVYGELIFYVKNAWYNSTQDTIHRYAGHTYPLVPQLYDNIQLTITPKDLTNTNVNSTHTVKFKLERKLLPTSVKRTIAGVNRACKLNTTRYSFTPQDNGQVSLSNVVRCTQKWFYRIVVTHENNNNVLWYIYFTILDTNDFVSSLYGFTSSQKTEAHEEYRTFMSQVNQREEQYPRLAYNTQWNTLWKNYYVKLNKLAYNKDGRLANYGSYQWAKNSFYTSMYNLR